VEVSDPTSVPSRATVLWLCAPWLALFAAEVWLSQPAQLHHGALQLLLEGASLVLLGACQWRLAKADWQRSPLWAGLLVVLVTGVAAQEVGGLAKALMALGGLCLGVAVLWALARGARGIRLVAGGPRGAVVGVVVALVGACLARWQVLEWGLVGDARTQLVRELRAPFSGTGPSGPPSDGPPVVIISIDTLRWDSALEMDSFKRVAARGAWWERAMTSSSWTLPSMASLQSGRTTQGHGAGLSVTSRIQALLPEVPLLAEQLSGAGYSTAAVVANPWLSVDLGFSRGVHDFVQTHAAFPHRLMVAGFPSELDVLPWHGEIVVDTPLDILEDAPERGFYLWVHFLDPHLPYFHAEPGSLAAELGDYDLRQGKLLSPDDRRAIAAAYADEVAYTDRQVTRLLDALEARGVLDAGVVVILSDHGEEFWDHGFVEHSHSHHTEVVDTAMAISGPGVSVGRRSDLASIVDVAPTVLGMVGLPNDNPDGYDLRSSVPPERIATAWGNGSYRIDRSARKGSRRVIVEGDPDDGGRVLVYDHSTDPLEQRALPVDPADPLVQAALAVEGPAEQEGDVMLHTAALQALGYLD